MNPKLLLKEEEATRNLVLRPDMLLCHTETRETPNKQQDVLHLCSGTSEHKQHGNKNSLPVWSQQLQSNVWIL